MIPEVNEGTIDFNQPKKVNLLEQFEANMIAKNIITYSNAVMYRGYRIYHNGSIWPNYEKFEFCHEDYDGAPDSHDHRFGHGHTLEDCIKNINEQIEELAS